MPLGTPFVEESGETIYPCSICQEHYSEESLAAECCTFSCPNCGATYPYEDEAVDCCTWRCPICGERHDSPEEAEDCCSDEPEEEDWQSRMDEEEARRRDEYMYPHEVLELPVEYLIQVPELARRQPRLCSIEQEISAGAVRVAHLLYDLGLSYRDRITNYSADTDPGTAIVKQDGSLPSLGGEVLYSRFNLAQPRDSETLSRAIMCIRELRNRDLVSTSRSAGTHIHLAAVSRGGQVFGPGQMAALYEIFTFAEDVLFRLAAAGWHSHRGVRYTQLMPKDPGMNAGKLAKNASRGRHFSLNFQRILDAARSCSCGACATGDWQECECGCLQRGTIEWRIFNATTKPETLHGWLILAHALTAKSFDYTLGELKPNEYLRTPSDRHAWILGWILSECPMTRDEQLTVLALAKRSPDLNLDWAELESELILPRPADENGDDDENFAATPAAPLRTFTSNWE